ncbi:dTMP kinase [Rubrobacter taiwanensis]|uniref:Thymidylate kinase n=1 Tax=Rubrobacter taiwanensis TaxID=185139 RepID=A0A4V6NB55_9ACTN|nr:dTMP kinase [Rubrobacter taiwanensis]
MAASRGIFVTVEGLDFSGKSTLVGNLKRLLPEFHFTREPGGSPAAERIRELLLDPELEMDSLTEAYLYAAARADHTRRDIIPHLRSGRGVICERYLDSSLAYQGYGRGLGVELVRRLNGFAVGDLRPDVTFYLKLSAAARARRTRRRLDRLEAGGSEFMRRVEAGFEELVKREPDRFRVLDAERPPEELAALVHREISGLRRG